MPHAAIKTDIAESLNIIIQIERRRPGTRFVSEVLEIKGYTHEKDQYDLGQAYKRHSATNTTKDFELNAPRGF